jgi:putative peptidoglycan lipid II flippase
MSEPEAPPGPAQPPPAPPTPAPARRGVRYFMLLVQSAGQILAGFVLSLECAYFFGAGRVKDAWDVAFLIPDALLSVAGFALMQGVATAVFARLIERREADVNHTFSALLSLLLCTGAGASLLGALLGRPIVRLIAPGLDAAGADLALTQLYLLLPLTLLMGTNMFLGAVQTAYGFAGANELGWLVLRLVVVLALLLVPRSLGITGLSLAYIGGGVIALAIQVRLLRRTGLRYRFTLRLGSPEVRTVLRQAAGFGVSSILTQIAALQMRHLASKGPAGTIAALGYALSVAGLVYQFVAKPLMLVEGPRIIRRREVDGEAAAHRMHARIILVALALTVPVVAVMFFAREPIVRLLFQRGAFDAAAAVRTAAFLGVVSLSAFGDTLVAVTLLPALARGEAIRAPGAFVVANLVQIAFMAAAFPALGIDAVLWGVVVASAVRGTLLYFAGRRR